MPRELIPGHMTTGSRIRYVHWIERVRFSRYRVWNRVSSPYLSRDIDVLIFKGDFALVARFWGGIGGRNFFFQNFDPSKALPYPKTRRLVYSA